MTINDNLMNIAPLHVSKDYWYCKRPTAHASCVGMPIVKNGFLPQYILTAKGTLPASADAKSSTFTFAGDFAGYNGTYTGVMTSDGRITLERDHDNVIVVSPRDDGYNMEFSLNAGEYTGSLRLSEEDITSPSGTHTVLFGNTEVRFSFTAISTAYNGEQTANIELHAVEGDALMESKQFVMEVELVPENMQTTQRVAWIYLEGVFDGNYSDGAYYIKVSYTENTTPRVYFSEPFQWVTDVSQYVRINYRRTQPVVTTENYLPFLDSEGAEIWLTMYVKSNILAPPFSFNAEVTETDGRKFTEKQVSYRSDKFGFLCTAYFVEAVRLLWHCDKRVVSQPQMLYDKAVDYMELPEVSWDSDNHLCDVSLTFQSDTVVQTNGLATERRGYIPSTHTAFDDSFDNSYN